MGRVILVKVCPQLAPSIAADSYKLLGICFKPARKINIGEPNCQAARIIKLHNAVEGWVIQPKLSSRIPQDKRMELKAPYTPKSCRHITATATLPPISDGI